MAGSRGRRDRDRQFAAGCRGDRGSAPGARNHSTCPRGARCGLERVVHSRSRYWFFRCVRAFFPLLSVRDRTGRRAGADRRDPECPHWMNVGAFRWPRPHAARNGSDRTRDQVAVIRGSGSGAPRGDRNSGEPPRRFFAISGESSGRSPLPLPRIRRPAIAAARAVGDWCGGFADVILASRESSGGFGLRGTVAGRFARQFWSLALTTIIGVSTAFVAAATFVSCSSRGKSRLRRWRGRKTLVSLTLEPEFC